MERWETVIKTDFLYFSRSGALYLGQLRLLPLVHRMCGKSDVELCVELVDLILAE